MAAITVCEKLVAAFSSANVSAELSLQLKALVPGAVHLSLHVAERQHNVVLASGNLLRPGLLTSTLHSLHESLVSLGLSPKLWHINQKPVLVPKEMLSVARATSCSVFLTLPLAEGTAASREVGPHGAFGFMMVAFPAREHLSSQAAKACIALALALSASCQLQLQQQCRMVANCLLLGNYHGEEPAAALMGGGASGAPGHTDAYALEDCEEDLGDERWELGSGEFGEDGELVADQEDGPGGSSSYHGHHTLRPGDFSDGGLGSGSSGGASSLGGLRHRSRASELAPRHDGLDGLPASLVMDPLTLTFASPSAERAFQAHYTNNLLEGDLLTCLVSCVLLAVRVLSPGYTFTARHCLQYLVGMAPLPLLFCARQWYCRHRDSLLWILRLYGICYIHVRIGQYLGPATGLGVPKLAFAYGWLLLHSITWQLRFSHHLPVTVLAHALNIALLWRSSCPVGVPPMQPALECGLLAVLIGTLCVLPAVLLVYYKERRARRVFAAFFPYWE